MNARGERLPFHTRQKSRSLKKVRERVCRYLGKSIPTEGTEGAKALGWECA